MLPASVSGFSKQPFRVCQHENLAEVAALHNDSLMWGIEVSSLAVSTGLWSAKSWKHVQGATCRCHTDDLGPVISSCCEQRTGKFQHFPGEYVCCMTCSQPHWLSLLHRA